MTNREREVLRAISSSRSNTEIAHQLVIGGATVKSHVSRVLCKLELRDRAQAVIFAYDSGLCEPGDGDIEAIAARATETTHRGRGRSPVRRFTVRLRPRVA